MSQPEKRKAPRVTCSIGIHLEGGLTMVRARVEDVCRDGARLRVPLLELGLEPDVGMQAIATHIRHLLTRDVVAHLRPEMLGSLIQRQVQAVRIAPAESGEHLVDIGIEFDHPLTHEDAVTLGLPIPMDGESVEDAEAGLAGKAPRVRETVSTGEASNGGSAYADLRFALLVKKSSLGMDPENGRS